MIYYDLASKQDIIDNHYKSLKEKIEKAINKSDFNSAQKDFLKKNLQSIITSPPSILLELNRNFNAICPSISKNENLEKIFRYDLFTKKKKEYNAYDLAEKLDIRVCPYCNRNYTLTVQTSTKSIVRPDFDHYFAKSEYPMLALSIYNLIPSCKICNSTLKGALEFKLEEYIHPYVDDSVSHYKYTYQPEDVEAILGVNSNINVTLDIDNSEMSDKIRKTADVFKLEEIYTGHREEVRDLLEIKNKIPQTYIDQLSSMFEGLHISKEEAYKYTFGTYYNEIDFAKRPFSKLKKDILTELGLVE